MAPFAFQICNMLNAPADEYFTFQVTSLCHHPHPCQCREEGRHCPHPPESAWCLGVTRKHAQGLCPAYPGWPPRSRFFRQKRRGRRERGVREGWWVFVTLALAGGGVWGWRGGGGTVTSPFSPIPGHLVVWAQHRCSVNGLRLSDWLKTSYHLDSALYRFLTPFPAAYHRHR